MTTGGGGECKRVEEEAMEEEINEASGTGDRDEGRRAEDNND